jgi:ABC-type nickel/cobalt efflux system permease component RcnA
MLASSAARIVVASTVPVAIAFVIDANTAPIILALATFITAFAAAIVLIYNAMRQKRMEAKLDTGAAERHQIQTAVDKGAVEQHEIHTAVNSKMTAALDEIVVLKRIIEDLQAKIIDLKQEIVLLKGLRPNRGAR